MNDHLRTRHAPVFHTHTKQPFESVSAWRVKIGIVAGVVEKGPHAGRSRVHIRSSPVIFAFRGIKTNGEVNSVRQLVQHTDTRDWNVVEANGDRLAYTDNKKWSKTKQTNHLFERA